MYINELEIERFKASTNRKKNELTNYVRLITHERVQKCRLNRVKLPILWMHHFLFCTKGQIKERYFEVCSAYV